MITKKQAKNKLTKYVRDKAFEIYEAMQLSSKYKKSIFREELRWELLNLINNSEWVGTKDYIKIEFKNALNSFKLEIYVGGYYCADRCKLTIS